MGQDILCSRWLLGWVSAWEQVDCSEGNGWKGAFVRVWVCLDCSLLLAPSSSSCHTSMHQAQEPSGGWLAPRTEGCRSIWRLSRCGSIEHAQKPAGGFCVDEDWAAAVELGAKGLRSSRRRARRSTAQRTGQGHENVANRKPYHRRGRR